jgi:hypothetical protein
MANMHPKFHIIEASQRINYFLGLDKNNHLNLKLSHETPYVAIRYRQNSNHYNKILDNAIVYNQYLSITVHLFFIGGLFMLKPFKIQTGKSYDFHNLHFKILDIDGSIIKFLSSFHVRMTFF